MKTKSKFPLVDLFDCAHREAIYRRTRYPKWVAQGRMNGIQAEREIAMMEVISELLRKAVQSRRQIPLFGGDDD